MLEIDRQGSIRQQPEEKRETSVMDVSKSIGWRSHDAVSSLVLRLNELEKRGLYSSEMGEKAIDIAERYNAVSAERFIENCGSLWQNPKFKFSEYSDLVSKAYQMFGSLAGGYFSLSYSKVFNLGINPKDYFDWVDGAIASVGKTYAGWYAYGLPAVLEKGGDPLEFRSNACRVYRRGGLKVAVPFILNAPETIGERKIGLEEFSNLALESIETLGKNTASHVVRNMADLDNLGYSCEQFLSDVQKISDKKGDKAALWYVLGFTGLIKQKKRIENELSLGRNSVCMDEDMEKWRLERAENLEKASKSFNPLIFGKEYIKLLKESGKSAATFYSLSANKWDNFRHWEILEEMENFKLIPHKITELRLKVSKKVFNSALWFILKMGHNPKTVVRHLEDTMIFFDEIGEEGTIRALKYTAGIGRRKGYPFGLSLPSRLASASYESSEIPLSEDSWLSLLREMDSGIIDEAADN